MYVCIKLEWRKFFSSVDGPASNYKWNAVQRFVDKWKKSAQRDANTVVVRFGHRPSARPSARCKHPSQRQDR